MKKLLVLTAALAAFSLTAVAADQLADWTFETSQPATAGPYSPELSSEIISASASGHHAGTATYSSPVGDGSSHSYSANVWAVNDYWQFLLVLDTADYTYSGFTLSFDQNGSATGPKTFYLEWSTDGSAFTKFGSDYSLTSGITWSSSVANQPTIESFDLSTVAGLNTASTVYFRLVDDGTVSVSGGTVSTAGTDRVDNFIINALVSPVPEPSTLAMAALGGAACVFAFRRRSR